MNINKSFPSIISEISLKEIQKVVVGLEGNWNPTVVTIWTRDKGSLGFSRVIRTHPSFKPSMELYFENTWIGIHCYNRSNGKNIFDEEFAARILDYIETKCETSKL